MNTKLTLRLDEKLIKRAKAYARRSGKSVSQIVADFFVLLGPRDDGSTAQYTPVVKSLKGVLSDKKIDDADYKRHLEEKYL